MNEDMLDSKFREFPWLERTVLAHEAGHAVFHANRAGTHQLELGLSIPVRELEFVSDADSFSSALSQALAMRGPVEDDWWREWQANTFTRFILMPKGVLLPLLEEHGFLRWHGVGGLYELRDRLGVTISALVVHLSKLGYIRVDNQKRIHDATVRGRGQRVLDA